MISPKLPIMYETWDSKVNRSIQKGLGEKYKHNTEIIDK